MIFERLRLVNFRNYRDVVLSFSPRVNVFLGENGQGKTNLLEAMYMISQGDSFRYSDNSTLINTNTSESVIQALITQNDLHYKLKLGLSKSRKVLTLNDKRVNSADIRKIFASVVFSPESLSSIKEGADHRRELVDELLVTFDRKNAQLIADYRKALKTRNKILKNFLEGLQDKVVTQNLLESLNPQFVRLATDLTHARITALHGLSKDFNNAMQYISGNSSVDISVEYLVSDQNAVSFTREEVENAITKRLRELHDAELSSGTSLVGPHKHDIVFLYGQKDSRFFCSQGQQRAIILSFKMAQIVYHRKAHGTYPVLMLDDVLSELDKAKRDALITFLHEINTQIFVTTTDFTLPESFSLDQLRVVRIKDGQILE
ncbi:DNA replication and repair protein RecF [Bdellovibrio bacteriovorus]|uniref:DNA replication and repair protein RecF n=1 Tax=Bdellovibrio bacteriovorus (strain ATCC 15356 / DSM 50701 / NCIMB 9529 / HD100) TaxID=264462 RepID=Q6MRR9_BDEBA|nr:DNA replication and repair protein RecF [Bdellovibrio bacteriovorus]CAE77687.1 DNA repair and genetic recombination protein [Bdellovibrio bacteriovorus HD100]